MEIKYKVIETKPEDNQIVVRFFTDVVTEQHLNVNPEDSSVSRCKTDALINVPLLRFTPDELHKYIISHCNTFYLEEQELQILSNAQNTADPYQHNKGLITSLGNEVKTFNHVPWVPITDDDWRSLKLKEIVSKRDDIILNGGFKVTHGGKTYWFHSNTVSTCQQLGLVIAAILTLSQGGNNSTIIHPVKWLTLDKQKVDLTVGLVLKLLQDSFERQGTLHAVGEQKKASLISSNDPKHFDSFSGWPLTYAEEVANATTT